MAKNPVFDFCMFCDQVPCICNAKPKRTPKPRKKAAPKTTPEPVSVATDTVPVPSSMPEPATPPPAPKASPLAAMRAAAARSTAAPVALPTSRDGEEIERFVEPQEVDDVTHAAIVALGPILDPRSSRQYAKVLLAPVPPSTRAEMWRNRRSVT